MVQSLGLNLDSVSTFDCDIKLVEHHQIPMGNKAVRIFQQVVEEHPQLFLHAWPWLWRDDSFLTMVPTVFGRGNPVGADNRRGIVEMS
jgi:hypothetical protein